MPGAKPMAVPDLVTLLRGVPAADFNPSTITGLLSDVSVDGASLAPYMFWTPKIYTRNLIYRDDVFELLALCWERGCSSPIHDHAGQPCWFLIHQGILGEDVFELVNSAHAGQVGAGIDVRRVQRVSSMDSGTLSHRGLEQEIHRIYNRRSYGQRAVSLHVYAKPIDHCIVYEPTRRLAIRRILAYHTIDGKET